jgi:raffinose/stachyose/melibiose transport system substrate-binding protein
MRIKAFAAAAAGAMLFSSVAMADTTIHILHLQTDPAIIQLWSQIGHDYEAANPGVKIDWQFLENEALKAKIPTLLQSDDRPNLFHSWGGGVMRDQIKSGFIGDITADSAALEKELSPGAASAFVVDGKVIGAPFDVSEVSFFYNKALFAKAGVKADDIKTWDDFLGAIKKLKAAGITPIVVGAADKWPMHFYWSYLVMRIGGGDILSDARAGKDGGFKGPAFVEAGKRLKELADLQPFQEGYLGTKWDPSAGLWGDGKGAIQLMGNWFLGNQAVQAADKKGQPLDNIGIFSFPSVPGGKGKLTDTLGGLDGFLVSKGAPKETASFLTFFSQAKYQRVAAEKNLYIPAALDTGDSIGNPVLKEIADKIAHSTKHQLFFDQDLGSSVGGVVNDVSVAIAAGQMSPEDGAAAVQKAWDEK